MSLEAPLVVAFIGKRGSGKNTAALTLIEKGFKDVKFADPLKNMLRAFFYTIGLDVDETERYIEGDLKEEHIEMLMGKTTRYAMQTLGTEWRDMIHRELWSKILFDRVSGGSCGRKVVVTDFRFPHEQEVLRALGASIVKIEGRKEKKDEASLHISETAMDSLDYDFVIKNNRTIPELRREVLKLAEKHGWLEK